MTGAKFIQATKPNIPILPMIQNIVGENGTDRGWRGCWPILPPARNGSGTSSHFLRPTSFRG